MSDELKLRELLWLRHGCSVVTLYGDDGNMQCSKCGIDFLHDSVASIESQLTKRAPDDAALELLRKMRKDMQTGLLNSHHWIKKIDAVLANDSDIINPHKTGE